MAHVADHILMSQWVYARMIVNYEGVETREKGLIFKTQVEVDKWTMHWYGPGGAYENDIVEGHAGTPVKFLNDAGALGWELVAAFHQESRYEYVFKAESGDG